MAYDRYVPEITASDGLIYGIKDTEAREAAANLNTAFEQLNDNVIVDSASGAIASVTDGADGMPMRSVVVDIEPVQDLHGYDSPWPAGGKGNLFEPLSGSHRGITFTANSDGTVTISGTAAEGGWTYLHKDYLIADLGLSVGDTVTVMVDNTYVNAEYYDENNTRIIAQTTSNKNTHQIPTGTVTVRLVQYAAARALSVGDQINAVAKFLYGKGDISTWAPYSNVCPITGWTGCKVTRAGRSLYEPVGETWYQNASGTQFWGTYFPALNTVYSSLPVGQYTISFDMQVVEVGTGTNLDYGVYISQSASPSQKRTPYQTRTVGQVIHTKLTFSKTNMKSSYVYLYSATDKVILKNFMIAVGDDDSYEPYAVETYNISWATEAGTVYGGTLDAVAGKLVVDRAAVDLGTLEWEYVNSVGSIYYFRSNSVSPAKTVSQNADVANILCSNYQTKSAYDVYLGENGIGLDTTKKVRIHDANYSDATSFATAMSGVQFCHELAQPVEVTLDATEILTLLGINHVYSDAGNTSIEYPADTKLYIDRKITQAIANAMNA